MLSELTPIFGKFKVATSSGTIAERCWSCSDTHRRNTAFYSWEEIAAILGRELCKIVQLCIQILKEKNNFNLFKHLLLTILKTFDLGNK